MVALESSLFFFTKELVSGREVRKEGLKPYFVTFIGKIPKF
jgi:hypothetical protein